MMKAYNSHGCVPGQRCRCPRVFTTCTAWEVLKRKAAEGDPQAVDDLAEAEAMVERKTKR